MTIAETSSPLAEPAPLEERPRQFRLRTASESLGDGRRRPLPDYFYATPDDALLFERNVVQRSASCSEVYAQRREAQRREIDCSRYRVRLRCRDEAMCVRSKQNVLRLVEAVQKDDSAASSTSVLLAKKALKYRRLLERAQRVDLSDPTFDVAQFLSEKREGRTQLVGLCEAPQAP